jgi:hypothetical protein
MPLYLFSIVAAPKFILKAVYNLQHSFLWGGAKKETKWPLVSWEKNCRPKQVGGLGLRDPKTLSSILRAKTWWRWLHSRDDLRKKNMEKKIQLTHRRSKSNTPRGKHCWLINMECILE